MPASTHSQVVYYQVLKVLSQTRLPQSSREHSMGSAKSIKRPYPFCKGHVIQLLLGWRPSLLGWRPSLLGWRPSLLGWRHICKGHGITCIKWAAVPFAARALSICQSLCGTWTVTWELSWTVNGCYVFIHVFWYVVASTCTCQRLSFDRRSYTIETLITYMINRIHPIHQAKALGIGLSQQDRQARKDHHGRRQCPGS